MCTRGNETPPERCAGLSAAFVLSRSERQARGQKDQATSSEGKHQAIQKPQGTGQRKQVFHAYVSFFIEFFKSLVEKKKKKNLCCDAVHRPLEHNAISIISLSFSH